MPSDPRVAPRSKAKRGITKYSARLHGDAGNWKWPAALDYNDDGYLGISQEQDGAHVRVLLSPGQLLHLRSFTRRKPR